MELSTAFFRASQRIEERDFPRVEANRERGSIFTEGQRIRVKWMGNDLPSVSGIINSEHTIQVPDHIQSRFAGMKNHAHQPAPRSPFHRPGSDIHDLKCYFLAIGHRGERAARAAHDVQLVLRAPGQVLLSAGINGSEARGRVMYDALVVHGAQVRPAVGLRDLHSRLPAARGARNDNRAGQSRPIPSAGA